MVSVGVRPSVLCVGLAAAVGLGGCRSAGESGVDEAAVASGERLWLDETRWLGAPVQVENLTVWPIHATATLDIGEFLTLKEAEEKGVAIVREVGTQAGPEGVAMPPSGEAIAQEGATQEDRAQEPAAQEIASGSEGQTIFQGEEVPYQSAGGAQVNTVVVENQGDLPILVCAGTVIKGGQQDRQIARDLVIGPKKTVPVDAFCVEVGRWTVQREGTSTLGLFSAQDIVTTKRVRSKGQYSSSQQEVWEAVAAENEAAGNSPETGTLLATIEDDDEESLDRRARFETAVRERFDSLRNADHPPVGFAYSIDGKPVTVRTFAHARLLEKQLEPFAKAMAIEADISQRESEADGRKVYAAVAPASEVVTMVRSINEAREEFSETGAENRNGIRQSDAGGNLNCYAEIFVHAGQATESGAGAPYSSATEAAAEGATEARWVPVTQDWTAK